MCHPNKDPGETIGIAGASLCMQCHSTIKPDSPAIGKLAEASKTAKPLKWRRVYEIPTYVYFSHRTHLNAGNACEDCHGQVAQRDVLAREADISMKGCMTCHTAKKASNDCTTCHDQRN
jgi:c(7)-type cytochrome triheme protein